MMQKRNTIEKKNDDLGEVIATLGLVTRKDSSFVVKAPDLHGGTLDFEVWRDDQGKIRCSCSVNDEHRQFRCEHILSVKHALRIELGETLLHGHAGSAVEVRPVEPECNSGYEAEEYRANASMESSVPFFGGPGVLNESLVESINAIEHGDNASEFAISGVLDTFAPGWSHLIRSIQFIGGMVVVTVAVTINGTSREGVGTATAETEDGLNVAETRAMISAAAKFGIRPLREGSDVEVTSWNRAQFDRGNLPADNNAYSMGELVTPRQLGMILTLSRDAGIDPEQEALLMLNCTPAGLARRAASEFIEYLQILNLNHSGGLLRAS